MTVLRLSAGSASVQSEASAFMASIRPWSNHTFDSALAASRTESERASILDMYYKKYQDAVVAAPADHGYDAVYLLLHIEKDQK